MSTAAAAAAAVEMAAESQVNSKAPAWSGPEGFIQYEEDVEVWLFMTTLPDSKKGGAMRMALSGLAYEAARTVPVATLTTAEGHTKLLQVLRTAFGGSERKRGHASYHKLHKTYRGDTSMEAYLANITLALAECKTNGYTMGDKTASAVIINQAGLDQSQQASTTATAAMHTVEGMNEVTALTTAMRDLWGGEVLLKSSPNATMVITYAQHEALLARRAAPGKRGINGTTDTTRGQKNDSAGCWHCGNTGHVRRECRTLAKENAAKAGSAATRTAKPANEAGYIAEETAHLVLIANGDEAKRLAAKTGDVILDVGATATIAGAAWVAAYVALLAPTERTAIRSIEAAAVFTFGGGHTQRAHERVTLPMMIGGRRCLVQTWVVAGHLPMLLSRKSMSSLGVVLDVAGRRMHVKALDVIVGLSISEAGHLTFNALDKTATPGARTEGRPKEAVRGFQLMAVLTKDTPALARAATKLHTQYGHTPAVRLNGLLRQQGVQDKEVFAAVTAAVDGCEACKQTAPRPSRPLVTVPRALPFNHTLAVDLAEVAPLGQFVLIVDLGTRFSRAIAIPNKLASTVVRALLMGWLVHHGAPLLLLTDPGGEFTGTLWRAMAERFNIGVAATATQAHFSNGVVERYNQTIKTMVTRIRQDHPVADAQELLDLACLAMNSMSQHNGATPYQLMCGSTPRVPTALTSNLPALEETRVAGDEALQSHLQLLHASRVAHAQAEADVSLRRALARNASNVPHRDWVVGDVVYYWTEGVTPSQGGWHGPAHVTDVAVAKRSVRLQHGHGWTNRHVSQLRLAGEQDQVAQHPAAEPGSTGGPSAATTRSPGSAATTPGGAPTAATTGTAETPPVDSAKDNEDPSPMSADEYYQKTKSMMEGVQAALKQIEGEPVPTSVAARRALTGVGTGRTRANTVRFCAACTLGAADNQKKNALHLLAARPAAIQASGANGAVQQTRIPRAESVMTAAFTAPDTLAAALQRTGVAEHHAFVTRRELRRRAEVPIGHAGTAFNVAMARELEAWSDLAVYTEVPYTGQAVISMRWVLTIKEPDTPSGAPRRKARLVVRGFEDPDRDAVDSTSPTASRGTLRVALSAMATHGFVPRTVDVRTAFLQGMPLDRPTAVFVQPPPQARVPPGTVWQLRKCAYGLTDAPRRWYESVLVLMRALNLQRSSLDHGLFTAHEDGKLVLVVAVHVDDFIIGGTTTQVARFDHALRAAFAAGPTKSGDLTFTGLRVRTSLDDDNGRITLLVDQEAYIDSIDDIEVRPERAAEAEARLTPVELTSYRRATGALLWATGQTLPYLACATSSLARRFTCAVVRDLAKANRVIAAVKAARPMPLMYMYLRGPERLRLFTDASSVKLGEPTAHTGFAIFSTPSSVAAGRLPPDAPLVLLQYASHRQRRVTHSSFAAEVYALLEGMRAVKELAVVHALVHTGDEYAQAPVDVYTDNLSLFNTLDADGVVQPKEVGAAVQELREMYHNGVMSTMTWLRARGQLADALTKAGRNTPLQQTVASGTYGVRLANGDYLTKTSASAPTLTAVHKKDDADDNECTNQDGVITERRPHDDASTLKDDPDWGECEYGGM